MTVDVATPGRTGTRKPRTTRAKPRPSAVPEPLVIGEPDKSIFNCPVCVRPLAVGASRCPGCRTRLVLATPAKKALIFVLIGAVTGLVLAWGVSAALALTSTVLTQTGPEPSAVASAPVAATPVPVAATPVVVAIPPTSRSAISQAAALNIRLAEGARLLRTAVAERDLDSAAVADILRSLAADASFGEGLATRLAAWNEATGVAQEVGSLYSAVLGTSLDGLKNSINNDPAYRAAAQKMLNVLNGVTPVDVRIRTLASVANVALPPAAPNGN